MAAQIGKAILFLIVDSAKVCPETWMKIAGLETDTGAPSFAQSSGTRLQGQVWLDA
jgi:hypothetical protein